MEICVKQDQCIVLHSAKYAINSFLMSDSLYNFDELRLLTADIAMKQPKGSRL